MKTSPIPVAVDAETLSRLTTILALAALVGAVVTGWTIYRSSVEEAREDLLAINSALAQAVVAHAGELSAEGVPPAKLRKGLASFWAGLDAAEGRELLVLGPEDVILWSSRPSEAAGQAWGGRWVSPPGAFGSGLTEDRSGTRSLASFVPADDLGERVGVLIPEAAAVRKNLFASLPLRLDLAFAVALLLPVAFVWLQRAYRRAIENENALLQEFRQAETAVVNTELRFRAIFEGGGLGVALVNSEGRLIQSNPAFQELLLWLRGTADVDGLSAIFEGPAREKHAGLFGELIRGERERYQVEERLTGVAGKEIWVQLTVTRASGSQDAGPAAVALLEDVSEQRRLRGALEHAATEWRDTFDAISTPIVVLHPDGRVGRLNQAARRLLGNKPFAEIVDVAIDEVGTGALWREVGILVRGVAVGTAASHAEVEDRELGRVWDVVVSRSAHDQPGQPRLTVAMTEITHLLRLQESLRKSSTMAALGALVGGVAHEVRNPLFGMSALVDALERRVKERPELGLERHLTLLRGELDRLNRLMADLLEYGKPPRLEVRRVALRELVESALAICRREIEERGISVEVEGEVPAAVEVDRERVVQVLANVVSNAGQHSPPEQPVTVTLRAAEGGEPAWLSCQVRDRGPGFPPEDLHRVLEPFFSRRPGGTGLGLAIVARVMEAHGGTVEVANHPEGGALVTLRFPAASAGKPEDPESET